MHDTREGKSRRVARNLLCHGLTLEILFRGLEAT